MPETRFSDSVDGALFGNIAGVNHAFLGYGGSVGHGGSLAGLAGLVGLGGLVGLALLHRLDCARCREGDAGQGAGKPYPYQGPRTPHHQVILSEGLSVVLTDLIHRFSTPKRITWDHAL